MNKITSICLDEMGLNSIVELAVLSQLRYVSLVSNHLSDLSPLKNCQKLVELCASDNEIVRVSRNRFSNFYFQFYFYLKFTVKILKKSAVNCLPALQTLDLSFNQITELSLDKGLIFLVSLNLSGDSTINFIY